MLFSSVKSFFNACSLSQKKTPSIGSKYYTSRPVLLGHRNFPVGSRNAESSVLSCSNIENCSLPEKFPTFNRVSVSQLVTYGINYCCLRFRQVRFVTVLVANLFTPGRILQSLNVFGIGLNTVNTVLRVSEYLVLPVRVSA